MNKWQIQAERADTAAFALGKRMDALEKKVAAISRRLNSAGQTQTVRKESQAPKKKKKES